MKKEQTQELKELSLKCFGKPYEWRKLRTKGLIVGHDKDFPAAVRRIPLTYEQVKDYMVKTLEMREAMKQEQEASKDAKSGE